MRKWIKVLAVVGVLAVLLTAHTLAAQDATATFVTQGSQTQVTITLEKEAMAQGVSALQAHFLVQATQGELTEDNVTFQFDPNLPGTIQRYVYNAHTGLLSVYVAGANGALFDGLQAVLGSIHIQSAQPVQAQVSFGQEGTDPLTLLTGTNTQTSAVVQRTQTTLATGAVTPTPTPQPDSTPNPETTGQPETTAQPGATTQPEASAQPEVTTQPESTPHNGDNQTPPTGDSANLALPVAVLATCAVLLVAAVLLWRHNSKKQ